jgi:hypothetical protein
MYNSIGKCKNFDPLDLFKKDDCRNCSHRNPKEGREFKVGDWCKNYETKVKQYRIAKSELLKPKPRVINPKDFNNRRT